MEPYETRSTVPYQQCTDPFEQDMDEADMDMIENMDITDDKILSDSENEDACNDFTQPLESLSSNVQYIGLEKNLEYFSYKNNKCFKWVNNTCIPCKNCCHTFSTPPIGMIVDVEYEETCTTVLMQGVFCSWECYKYYVIRDINIDRKSRRLDLMFDVYIELFNGLQIGKCPSVDELKFFGGKMDIDKFRENFKPTLPAVIPRNIKLYGICATCTEYKRSEEKARNKPNPKKNTDKPKMQNEKPVVNMLESIMGIKKK